MELNELKNVDLDLREFCNNIVKYQKFQTKKALQKFEYKLSNKTADIYFGYGVIYINSGIKNTSANKKLYEYIDEAISQHVQPLTPKDNEKRRVLKNMHLKKKAVLPVQKVVKELTKQSRMCEKFEYGVMYDDNIKVFGKDSTAAKIFLAGITFVGKIGKLVAITEIK